MSYTKLEWHREGTTIYALEFDSWSRGKEVLRNRFSAHMQGYRDTSQEELEANARLMSAAPDLLEALQELVHIHRYSLTEEMGNARAAIKKALGE